MNKTLWNSTCVNSGPVAKDHSAGCRLAKALYRENAVVTLPCELCPIPPKRRRKYFIAPRIQCRQQRRAWRYAPQPQKFFAHDLKAGDADDGDVKDGAKCLSRGHANAQARVTSRSLIDENEADALLANRCLAHGAVYRGNQVLTVRSAELHHRFRQYLITAKYGRAACIAAAFDSKDVGLVRHGSGVAMVDINADFLAYGIGNIFGAQAGGGFVRPLDHHAGKALGSRVAQDDSSAPL